MLQTTPLQYSEKTNVIFGILLIFNLILSTYFNFFLQVTCNDLFSTSVCISIFSFYTFHLPFFESYHIFVLRYADPLPDDDTGSSSAVYG
jgi:hypothetical protein